MCEPASHARQTCEALENTLVSLNSTPVSLNSTSVSLQLALRYLAVSFYIGIRDFLLARFRWLTSHARQASHFG